MNYNYGEAFWEIEFPSGNIRRLKKSSIIEISQLKNNEDKSYIKICTSNDSFYIEGWTLEEFDKKVKTIYI